MFSLDALGFFAQSPGDIIYFLLVILLLQANLLFVNGFSFNSVDVPPMRVHARGVLLIVGFWVIYVIASVIAIATTIDARLILPPIERGAILGSLGVFTWIFTRRTSSDTDLGIPLIAYLIVVVFGVGASIANWNALYLTNEFNQSIFHQFFVYAGLVISIASIALFTVRSRYAIDTPLKIALMGIIAAGFVLSIIQMMGEPVSGDEPGILRLAYVIALAIAPYIVYRLSQYRIQEAVVNKLRSWQGTPRVITPLASEDRVRTSPNETQSMQLLRALGRILDDSNPESIPRQIVSVVLDTCRGDVAALIRLQDVNYADLTDGYDRTQKRKIPSTSVNLSNQPTLMNAIERKTQRALYLDRNQEELQDIYTRLNIEHVGPIYFQPLLRDEEVVAVLMLGLPYAQHELTGGEAELLNGFGIMASDLLQLSYEAKEARLQAEQRTIDAMLEGVKDAASTPQMRFDDIALPASSSEELNLARSQISELTRQVMELKLRLDDERTRLANMLDASDETLTVSQRIRAINEEQQRLREERDELRRRLKEAETALSSATTEDNRVVVDRIVETLKQEKDTLTAEREELQTQLDELRVQQTATEGTDVQEMINNMIEERSRLEIERDHLRENLLGIQSQLADLGIDEGTSGLAQLIGQLYEQRAELRERTEKLQRERDALLNERTTYETSIGQEKERDEQIANLQNQVENLAVDRDTMMRQRDKLRAERDEFEEKL
ncbi:MAG: hypothetical protein KC546_10265, partial [Anaerolineae bacterium]|nr:hypothetical protein [Anaerolineae bacterium]